MRHFWEKNIKMFGSTFVRLLSLFWKPANGNVAFLYTVLYCAHVVMHVCNRNKKIISKIIAVVNKLDVFPLQNKLSLENHPQACPWNKWHKTGVSYLFNRQQQIYSSVTKQAYRSKPWHCGSSTWNTRTVKHPTTALNLRITSKLDQLAETIILLCSSSFGTRVVFFCWCSFSKSSGRREGGRGWVGGCFVVFLFPR